MNLRPPSSIGLCFQKVNELLLPEAMPTPALTVLFEDNHCLAVVKPAALPTQGVADKVPSLELQVKEYLKERHQKSGKVYLGIPHRLDRPVSGVILFARNTKAARRLAEQFQQRQVMKTYWALVEGGVQPPQGKWEDWLLKAPGEARVMCTEAGVPNARRAVLRYACINHQPGYSFLEIQPETGRTHQIRVQTAARGWPIIGDYLYGSKTNFGPPINIQKEIIALHSRSLTFWHPIRYEPITCVAPLPEAWKSYVRTDDQAQQ